jgi:hypothetical protein
MHAVALLLQGLGALVALTALALELKASRRRPELEPLPPPPTSSADAANPWHGTRVFGVTGKTPRQYPIVGNDLKAALENLHKDSRALAAAWSRADTEWERQQALNREYATVTRGIIEAQRQRDRDERIATGRRVLTEMSGLFLATIGMILS